MKTFLVIPIAMSLLLLSGYLTMAHAEDAVTYCDCILKPIVTDAKHAACSKMTESLGAQKKKQRKEWHVLRICPFPAGGPDVCFCMKSRSKDPALRKTCRAILKTLSDSQMLSKSRECGLEIYK